MDRGERLHQPLHASALEIVLHQVGELVVHGPVLGLVDAHDPRGEPEIGDSIPLSRPEHLFLRHGGELLLGSLGFEPYLLRDVGVGLHLPPQRGGYLRLFRSEDFLQHLQLHARLRPREPVRKSI